MLRSAQVLRRAASFVRSASRTPIRRHLRTGPFHSSLRECRSPSDVLDLVGRCEDERRCVSGGLMRMWQTAKTMTDEQKRCELRLMAEHPAFERLCGRARAEAPLMGSHDLAFTLMALSRLGVSQGSSVVQTVLRVAQERLNQFEDEKALSVLAVCLTEMDPCKNSEALKQGLKLILEDRIPTLRSVVLLHAAMRLFGDDAPPGVKHKLEARALSMAGDFTVPNAQHTLATLAAVRLRSKPLLDACSKKLTENVHTVPFTRLLEVLRSCRGLRYRNLALFTAISDYADATLTMWTNKQIILLLLQFKDLRYRPVALLDAFAERIEQNPDSLTLRDLQAVLESYSSLNHRHSFLPSLTCILDSYLPRMSGLDVLKAVSCLCVFAHFPQAALEKLFLSDVPSSAGSGHPWAQRMLRTVDSAPSPQGPPPNLALADALKSLVGDEAVAESVLVEGVYLVDYVITLPPSGEESWSSPPRIAVLLAPPSSYCFGTTHPCSALALKIRHLKLLGYDPAPVPLQELDARTGDQRMAVLRKYVLSEERGDGTAKSSELGNFEFTQ